jgi:hypothetical protein
MTEDRGFTAMGGKVMDNKRLDKGFTFYICFGKFAGFKIFFDGPALRIVLGCIGIGFVLRDLDMFLAEINQIFINEKVR